MMLMPTLIWSTVTGASTYRVQVSTISTFATTIADVATFTEGTATFTSPLDNNTTYYWRANANNAEESSTWSEIWSFTTLSIVPGVLNAPNLTSPSNGSSGVSLRPSLTWSTVDSAVTYRIQLSTDSTFLSTVIDDSSLTAGSKTLTTSLVTGTKYYWRVDAKNNNGTGSWSTVWNFTTAASAPSAPILTSPSDAATGVAPLPTFTWGMMNGAATYRIQVSTNSTFMTTVCDDSTLPTGSKVLTTSLDNGTKFYWRVNAKNGIGTSSWSVIRSFTTLTALPGIPNLATPSNGVTGISSSPTLTWNMVSGATTYHVQLSTTSTFSSIIMDDSTITTGTKTLNNILWNATLYYWRVCAKNSAGTSGWSMVWCFSTMPSSGGITTITDVDGNLYHTVTIGTQTWTVENLKTTKYNDGTSIPMVTDSATWTKLTTPGYCWYNNDGNTYKNTYGALYNWYAVNSGKLVPAGWHVANEADWDIMQKYLIANGYNYDGTTDSNMIAKSIAAQMNWNTGTTTGTPGNNLGTNNRSGFSALPGGYRNSSGSFIAIGQYGGWWSATELSSTIGHYLGLAFNSVNLGRYANFKIDGFYVRLVHN